jgi:hypothetical protein
MLSFKKLRDKPTVLQQLTGLNPEGFFDLLPAFVQATQCLEQQAEVKRLTPRQRQKGGGRKPLLEDPANRLLFILFYFRIYPVQRVQAVFFGMSQTPFCEWVHRLTPVLNMALGAEQHLPERRPARLQQVLRQCAGLEFIIDGTEQPIQRPKDKRRQCELYSGKKKRHTVKNVVIVDRRTRKLKALSRTRAGKTGDKRVTDEEAYRFPKRSKLWKDTGFQGYEPPGVTTFQPKKRPRKGQLTDEEKAHNRAISQKRVGVEHAIGGAKVYRIAHHVFRNRREGFVDLSFETACGLHNLRCNYRLTRVA